MKPGILRGRGRSIGPKGIVGCVIFAALLIMALFPQIVAQGDPAQQDLGRRLRPPWTWDGDVFLLFGTDALGRDLWARTAHAAGTSMAIAAGAVVFAGFLGVVMGLLAGYFGGWLDNVITGLAEVQLAMPFILLAITIVSLISPEPHTLALVLGLTSWVVFARVTRSRVFQLREHEFIEAAKVLGASTRRIVFLHVLPQLWGVILVLATLEVGRLIVIESTLSFLGLGVQQPDISWGQVMAGGRDYIASAWWVSVIPGLAIVLAVLSVNLIGDWLSESYDPMSMTR